MTDDDLTSEAWSNSRDTGEHAFPELGGSGPHVYAYDVRGVRHYDRPPPRKHKPVKRQHSNQHQAFVPRPVTVGETPEAEAQRMRRDPMSAVRRVVDVVPFYKIRGA